MSFTQSRDTASEPEPTVRLWDINKRNSYVQNLNENKLIQINNDIDTLFQQAEITNSDVNHIMDDIESLFQETCKDTFGTHAYKNSQKLSTVVINLGLIENAKMQETFIIKFSG